MNVVGKKPWIVNVLSFAMAVCISVTSLLSSGLNTKTIVASADTSAKSRVQTFIGLAAGKSGNALPDIGQLTQDELQFLGVYLSNFYVPFSTELGLSESSDSLEEQKVQMVSALQSNLNFNETVCSELVENIMGLSRSNCYKLEYGFVSSLNDNPSSTYSASYWDFVNIMFGYVDTSKYSDKSLSNISKSGSSFIYSISEKIVDLWGYAPHYWVLPVTGNCWGSNSYNKEYVKFGYTKADGTFMPVCDAHLYNEKSFAESKGNKEFAFTSSQIAFFQCLLSANTDMGYGLNFFDIYNSDTSATGEDLLDYLYSQIMSTSSTFSRDDIYSLSAYGNEVYVDCFGNIFRSSPAHQTIIIPGCVNPYSWVVVDNTGEDIVSLVNNKAYMAINGLSLNSIIGGSLYSSVNTSSRSGGSSKAVFLKTYDTLKARLGSESDRVHRWHGVEDPWYLYFPIGSDNKSYNIKNSSDTISLPELKSSTDITATGYAWNIMAGDSVKSWDSTSGALWWSDTSASAKLLREVFLKGKSVGFGGLWLKWDSSAYSHSFHSYEGEGYVSGSTLPCPLSSSSEYDFLNLDKGETSIIDTMCFIDDIGAFGFDSSNSDIAYDSIQMESVLDSSGFSSNFGFLSNINSSSTSYGFNNIFSESKRGAIRVCDISDEAAVCLYTTYAIAGLYKDDDKASSVGKLGYRMNREGLPTITNAPLTFSQSYADETLKKEILNMIYYALKPDGIEYIKVAIRNKVNAILVDWHNNMVGTSGVGYTTGTTYYRTNYGYVTTPDLSEMQWTSSLLNLYNSLIPMLVVFMVVSMLVSFIIGTMSLQRAVLGTLVFSAFLLVPVNAINFVVEKSNNITNNIYGEKFIYWAVVQEETFGTALDTAATGESYENYIKTLYSTNSANQGGESIVVRWQAPKKMASLMLSSGDTGLLSSLQGSLLSGKFLNNALDGQSYLDGDSQYLYRDYSDLANMSRYIYNSIANTGKRKVVGTTVVDPGYGEYYRAGYTNGTDSTSDSLVLKSMYTKIYDDVTTDTILDRIKSGNIDQNSYLGINQDLFNVSVAYFNNTQEGTSTGTPQELYFDTAILNNASPGNETGVECLDDWLSRYYINHNSAHSGEEKWNSLMVYGIMSESPYYYFSWNMYDDDMNSGANASGGYRQMILGDGEGKYFYNMSGNGELKDFMNMRNFFYNVLPYLKKGNDIVRAFDERYGIFIYDGVPTDEGYLNDYTIQGDATLKYKYWHNLNVARLYEIYTPWLDLMYDCSYAKPCYVKALGEKYWVEDPLNPASYPAERPMIFSESEMLDYGLSEADLTEVERKILKFNREAQSDMYELLNYYNFSDLSLNTAAAMECTFIFNQVFSENGFFSSNINLYPQSFEIKDFSYDAFLRFILSTTTGDGMNASKDFYSDVVAKSSTTTAILLIVCDVLSQYVTPFAKVVFLIAIFVSAILLIMVTVFKVDPDFKFVKKLSKEIFVPLLEFFAITVLFAYVVSLFMGTGNNAVTQTADLSISLGDPNMVLIAMCVIDVVCIVLYCKLLLEIWSCIKQNASLVKNHVTGLVGGVVSIGAAGVSHIAGGFSKGSDSSGSGRSVGGGVGNESSRAAARASKRQSEVAEKADMGKTETERMSESRRATMKKVDSVSDEKRSKEINATIENGKKKTNSENQGNEKK